MAGSGSATVAAAATPVAPVHAGETAKVGRERPLGLPLIHRDASFGLDNLLLQLGDGVRHLPATTGDFAGREPGGFQSLQRFAVFPELNPVPSSPAIAVCNHDPES